MRVALPASVSVSLVSCSISPTGAAALQQGARHFRISKWQHRKGWRLQGAEGSQDWRGFPQGLALARGLGSKQSRQYYPCFTLKMLNFRLDFKNRILLSRNIWKAAVWGSREWPAFHLPPDESQMNEWADRWRNDIWMDGQINGWKKYG